jgi:spore germination cell wall hydrolase CwlJ-like protein
MIEAQSGAMDLHRELEIDTLARTIWGEARGEGEAGMAAVAAVIMNRLRIAAAHGSYWWGNSIIQICQKPFQFSCWNKDDPNYRKLLAVDGRDLYFATAMRIARRAAAGVLADPTFGATHYHAAGVAPYWAGRYKPVAVIGRQIFYRLE